MSHADTISAARTGLLRAGGVAALLTAAAWGEAGELPRPSPVQVAWHEQERLLFVCLGVATWEGTEYDADGKTDLSKIDPAGFSGDEVCAAAQAWGAREILLVAKHVGGFCWWPTETTDYCVRNTPWRHGKGDLVQEVADACRRHGLSLGLYLYPDDTRYTAAIGRGGRTDDPAKQEEWNRLFRRQWEEALAICGPDLVREVWFDGGAVLSLKDVFDRLAPNAVIFGGPDQTIRWVGNEAGIAPDPNWNPAGGPDNGAWLPAECDTPLYDHNWFWNPDNERKRKSLDHLLGLFLQSAGHGSVLLLNATPNTDGRIPEGDMARYREFGAALERNFGQPLAAATDQTGDTVELDVAGRGPVNGSDLWEDYRLGHRIRGYVVEGRVNGVWTSLAGGTAVGRRKIDLFAPVTADRIRVRVTARAGEPVIRRFQVLRVDDALALAHRPPVSRGCAARASTVHSAPYAAAFLVDGDTQTRWGATDNDPDPWVELDLGRPRGFARATGSELADRLRRFVIEVRNRPDEPWRTVHAGTRMGAAWSADFARVTARCVRLHVLEYEGRPGAPTIWEFQLHDRPDAWETVGAWQGTRADLDLSAAVVEAGRYEVQFVTAAGQAVAVESAVLLLEGRAAAADLLAGTGTETLRLSRTQAVGDGAATGLRAVLRAAPDARGTVRLRPAP